MARLYAESVAYSSPDGLGLVHSETSDGCLGNQGPPIDVGAHPPARKGGSGNGSALFSGLGERIEIDPGAARLKRMRCGTITGARLIDEGLRAGGRRTFPVMATLTYAKLDTWRSRHITAFLQHCRDWFRVRDLPFHYCWVAELQKRGAVHFHVVIWMPRGYRLPKPDKRGWWPHGMTKIEGARNPVGYLAKYVSKSSLAVAFPKGLRLHGRGGLNAKQRIEARWWAMPSWVRKWTAAICDVRRVEGGGVVCIETGEWRPSPWLVEFEAGHIFIRARAP